MTREAHDELRDLLLPYLYGALDDDEQARLEAALAESAELRAALERAKAGQSVLAEAAATPLAGETLVPGAAGRRAGTLLALKPAGQPGGGLRQWKRVRTWAAAAALLLIAAGAWVMVLTQRAQVADSVLDLVVEAPTHYFGDDLTVSVTTRSGNGTVPADVKLTVERPGGGTRTLDVRTDRNGTARVTLDKLNPAGGPVIVSAVASRNGSTRSVGALAVQPSAPVLHLQAPQTWYAGDALPVMVKATTPAGAPIRTTVQLDVLVDPSSSRRAQAVRKLEVETDRHGEARLDLGTEGVAGLVQLAARTPDNRSATGALLVREGASRLAYVSTDKPLYRATDLIRTRAVVLSRHRLEPQSGVTATLRLTDPRGTVVEEYTTQTTAAGVVAAVFPLRHAVGGDYTIEVVDPLAAQNEALAGEPVLPAFSPARRVVQVRNYRQREFLTTIDLDRDAYAPGEVGRAELTVRTRDDRIPADALLECSLLVDGMTVDHWTKTLPASGMVAMAFELPETIERGPASLSIAISSGSTTDNATESIPLLLDAATVEFYPEGGDLVAGLPTRVYFRARNPQGEPVAIEGRIVDDHGRAVASAAVETHGMGRFAFTPEAGRTYRLEVTAPDHIKARPELPAVMLQGVALATGTEMVGAYGPVPLELRSTRTGEHAVAIYLRGEVVAQSSVYLQAGEPTRLLVRPDTRMGGVLRITVLDPDGRPVAERLLARQPGRELEIVAEAERAEYAPHEPVEVLLRTRDASTGEPVSAILGVSVLDESTTDLARDEDTPPMPFHFLFGLEVDELEKVEAYLGDDTSAHLALDLLLGTQGWRRFAARDRAAFADEHGKEIADRIVPLVGSIDTPQSTSSGAPAMEMQIRSTTRDALIELNGKLATWQAGVWEIARGVGIAVAAVIALICLVLIGRRVSLPETGRLLRPALGLSVCIVVAVVALVSPDGPGTPTASGLVAVGPEAPEPINPVSRAGFRNGAAQFNADVLQSLDRIDRDRVAGAQHGPQAPGDVDAGAWLGHNMLPDEEAGMADVPGRARMPDAVINGLRDDGLGAFAEMRELELRELARGINMDAGRQAMEELQAQERDEAADAREDAEPAGGRFAQRTERYAHSGLMVREYAHTFRGSRTGERTDFTDVVYWNPMLVTGPGGEATVRFDLSSPLTSWQIRVEGHTADGVLGAGDGRFAVRLPFSVGTRLPSELGDGDRIDLPVEITNLTDKPMNVMLVLNAGEALYRPDGASLEQSVEAQGLRFSNNLLENRVAGSDDVDPDSLTAEFAVNPATASVQAGGGERLIVPLLVKAGTEGETAIRLTGRTVDMALYSRTRELEEAFGFIDSTTRRVRVVPSGYPVTISQSGVLGAPAPPVPATPLTDLPPDTADPVPAPSTVTATTVSTQRIVLPDNVMPGTLQARLRIFPSPVATMLAGIESMLRQPGGCFEQTSSSNYPNVMILQYLDAHPELARPDIRARAKSMLATGYQRLTGYECPGGGFEWWGKDPGHTALTGYGVLQFLDMAKVHDVDPDIVPRTIEWLMRQRDERGYFTQNRRSLHSWVAADNEHINTAYIAWAISEAGGDVEWADTLDVLRERGRESEDPYFSALLARTFFNLGLDAESREVVEMLAAMQQDDGRLTGESQSVTCARGRNLAIETTALSVLAFLQHADMREPADRAVNWLLGQRQGAGRFGATQGTVLALKALVEYAEAARKPVPACRVVVLRGGNEVAGADLAEGQTDTLVLPLDDVLRAGENQLELVVDNATAELPWTLEVTYRSTTPPTDPECAVRLTTALAQREVAEGATVPLDIRVRNTTDEGVPMTVAIVGVPAGLEPRVPQLREMKEAGTIDFFELRNREVILYWTGLDPNEEKRVTLDCAAAIPGSFTGPASSAYLYYEDDRKHWIEPVRVEIIGRNR